MSGPDATARACRPRRKLRLAAFGTLLGLNLACTPANKSSALPGDTSSTAEEPTSPRRHPPPSNPSNDESSSAPPFEVSEARAKVDLSATAPPVPDEPFPSDLPLHETYELSIEGDRNLRVAHADGSSRAAIVYLHGMCGNPKGADAWTDLATRTATVITVRANVPCPDRPGYKWPKHPGDIQPRIGAALSRVAEIRGQHLDTESVTLIGYSQGAHRAEKLAQAYPDLYPKVVLGGPPTAPDPERLSRAQVVAVLGGELENTEHMEEGQAALAAAGIVSRFYVLPGAHHGSYGPAGRRVMSEVFRFLAASSDEKHAPGR